MGNVLWRSFALCLGFLFSLLPFSVYADREPYSFLEVVQAGVPINFAHPDSLASKLDIKNAKTSNLSRFESALPLLQFYANRLIAADLPAAYAVIPIVESNNAPKAVSKAGAVGVWQLMPDTALKYGLRVDFYEDDRYLIPPATSAAIKHLRYLSGMFTHPYHVLAAYNWGEQNVLRLIKTSPNIHSFIDSPKLPAETRDYILRIADFWYALMKVEPFHPLHKYPNVNYFVIDVTSDLNFSNDPSIQNFLNPLQSSSRERLVPTQYFYTYFKSKVGMAEKKTEKSKPCENTETIPDFMVYVVQDGDSHDRIVNKLKLNSVEQKKYLKTIQLKPGLIIKIPGPGSSKSNAQKDCPW